MWLERIARFYERGLWTKKMVAEAVHFGKITAEEYKQIVGELYPAQ